VFEPLPSLHIANISQNTPHHTSTQPPLTKIIKQTNKQNKQHQANNWAVEKPVCDTVRCGETAYFNLRDGGSCAAGGEALIRDKSDTYDIKCSPPSGSLPTPCAACNGGSSDACTWSWTAPGTVRGVF
jgi:hypothetical protein